MKPFSHDDRDFVIHVDAVTGGYMITTRFLDGTKANHKNTYISFEDSDKHYAVHSVPGVEYLIYEAEEYVKAGHYYGSPGYEGDDL